ncbi:MAG: J domain-containing protein [Synergistaceae bacterium]|nr:J domain-containing protein [Synergistaceae bacterium]
MKENEAFLINSSYRTLELKPGADASQIRSAFRRLARVHHPDIAGAYNTKKYEQISNAYLLLKSLTIEELSICEARSKRSDNKKESFFDKWRRKQAEKKQTREASLREAREEAAATKEAREQAQSLRIDSILDKCVRETNIICKKKHNEKLNQDISDIIIRLLASRYEVRLMALRSISGYVNNLRIMEALLNMLKRYPITGEALDIINKLHLPPEYMQKIIRIVSDNAKNIDEQEILPFIRNVIFMIADNKNIISKLMEHPSLRITEFLISRWTFPALPNEIALKRIFSDIQNVKLIILTLNILKKNDKRAFPSWLSNKINELLTHDNVSVKLWARTVSSIGNMVK